MIIAFTLCSNNYLAHAKTLGDSFLKHHSDSKFIIGLVDRFADDYDYDFFSAFEIIPVEKIEIANFNHLVNKYNIVELNTSVKPAYIHYIFKNYSVTKLLYLDPDILVISRFDEVFGLLESCNIVLTPHICNPIDDEFAPTDYHTLRGGIFNLGFIALSNYEEIIPFLNWWHDRVIKYGYSDYTRNMFYDQLWINYVPVMFEKYFILKHPGYNMAVWNLHERHLTLKEDKLFVNESYPLRFFHFSSYKYNHPENINTSKVSRFTFKTRPDIKKVYNEYQEKLIANGVFRIAALPVFFETSKQINRDSTPESLFKKIYNRIKLTTKVLLTGSLN